jgi:RNA polymerase sigma-70 factor (ECF subfamily)
MYQLNYARILGYAVRRTESIEDAVDVVGETFLTAWRKLDEVPSGDQTRPWLYGVARRTLANQRRGQLRRNRLSASLQAELLPVVTDPSRPAEGDFKLIAAAFRRLDDDDREVLALVGWEGLDNGEIAAVLGCSRNAVRIRLHRARKRFARHLDELGAAYLGTKRKRADRHEQSDSVTFTAVAQEEIK